MIRRMPKQFWQLDPSSRREDTWFQWRVEQPEQQLQGEKIWNINGLNMERRKDAGPLGYGCRFDQVSCGCGSHAKFCSALEQVRSSALLREGDLKRLKIEDLIHTIDSAIGRSRFYVAWWFPSWSIMIHHVPSPALPLYQFAAALFAVSECASSGRRSMWLRSLALAWVHWEIEMAVPCCAMLDDS
jgi:hypothetical protein